MLPFLGKTARKRSNRDQKLSLYLTFEEEDDIFAPFFIFLFESPHPLFGPYLRSTPVLDSVECRNRLELHRGSPAIFCNKMRYCTANYSTKQRFEPFRVNKVLYQYIKCLEEQKDFDNKDKQLAESLEIVHTHLIEILMT